MATQTSELQSRDEMCDVVMYRFPSLHTFVLIKLEMLVILVLLLFRENFLLLKDENIQIKSYYVGRFLPGIKIRFVLLYQYYDRHLKVI